MNPLLHGLPALPSGHGGRVWSKQPGGGTGQNFKIEGEPMCKFLVTLDTFVGLKMGKNLLTNWHKNWHKCLDGLFWARVTRNMLNVNWEKNSINNFICHLSWLKKPSPTHTHPPCIHLWIFDECVFNLFLYLCFALSLSLSLQHTSKALWKKFTKIWKS